MADNVSITPGTGNEIAADEVTDGILGQVKVQFIKLMDGTLDSTNKAVVDATGDVQVDVNNFPASQTVNGTIIANAGSGTFLVDGSAHTQPVSGTFFQTTQPVSIAATVTVSGPLTDAQLRATPVPISGTVTSTPSGTQNVAVISTITTPVTGTFFQATQPVNGTITANAGTNLNTSLLALESGGNLASLNTKFPMQGQALAAASIPVVLTAAQLTTLTPLSSVSVSNFPATQPVSGPLTDMQLRATPVSISGTVTSTPSGTQNVSVTNAAGVSAVNIQDGGNSITVDGTFFQTTQPISVTSLPLPTGAATSANQSTEISSLATIATNTTNAGTPTVSGTVTANQGGIWTVQPGNTPNTASWLVEQRPPTIQTYAASIVGLVPLAAGATDLFTISGSATKTVKVLSLHISGNATTAVTVPLSIIKRSATNTGGTSTAPTVTPHDSNNAAGTAVVLAYTANPTVLGATVGMLDTFKLDLPASATATNVNLDEDFNDGQPYVLRGTAQILAINLNTSAITAGNLTVAIHWTEE